MTGSGPPLLHELHDSARARGIDGYRRMTKRELLDILGREAAPGPAAAAEPAGPTVVDVDRRGPLALLTLRGADNALGLDTLESLADEADRQARDESVWLVAITGAGRIFSAGADLESMRGLPGAQVSGRGTAACRRIAGLPVPTVALLNGHAVGGAVDLALACAWRLAGHGAKVRFIHNQLGYSPPWGAADRLADLVGAGTALRLFVLHELLSAADARALGVVDEVVADGRLVARAEAMAGRIARGGRDAVVATKLLVRLRPPAAEQERAFAALWDARSSTLQA